MTDIASLGLQIESTDAVETKTRLDDMSGAAKRAQAAMDGLSSGTKNSSGVALAAANATSKQAAAVTRLANAERSLSFQTSNVAAQFQDIGVQLASGQSPFLIALQQGTQLSAALGSTGGGLRGVLTALTAGFASVISPLSLITIGAIAAGGALYQMFTTTETAGDKSASTLKAFDALVEKIGKTSTVTGDQIKKMLDAPATWASLRADISETERALRDQLKGAVTDLSNSLRTLDTEGVKARFLAMRDPVFQTKQELVAMGLALRDNTTSAQAVKDSLDEMASAQTTPSSLYDTIKALRAIATAAVETKNKLDALGGVSAKGDRVGTNNIDDLRRLLENGGDVRNFNSRMGGLDWDKLVGDLKSQAKGLHPGGSNDNSAFASSLKSLQERTSALQAQTAAQALLNPLISDFGFAMAKAQASSDLLTAAERDKLTLTPAVTAKIDEQATAYANATVAMNKQNEAAKTLQQTFEFAKSSTASFFTSFRQGVTSGVSAIDALKSSTLSLLDSLATKLESMLADRLITGLFGSLLGSASADPWNGLRSVTGAASSAAAAASASPSSGAAKAAMSRIPSPRVQSAAGQGAIRVQVVSHISTSVDDDGKIKHLVESSGARVLKHTQANHDRYRNGQMHKDVENHFKRRREIG